MVGPSTGPVQVGPSTTGPVQVGPTTTGFVQVGPTTTGPVQMGPTTTGGWSKSSVHRRELSAGATNKLQKHATLSCEQAADTLRKHSGANHKGEHQLNSHFQKNI